MRTAADLGALALYAASRTDPRVGAAGEKLGVACAKGCAFCCHGMRVEVTPPEAISLAEYLRHRTPPERLPALIEELNAAALSTHKKSRLQIWEQRSPCFFLDRETGACTMYEARPLGCRSAMSLDARACASAHEGTTAAIPRPRVVDAIYARFASACMQAARTAAWTCARSS